MANGIFRYTCLGISLSMACPLFCAHCITESGPNVKNEMSLTEALKYIRDAGSAVNHISFTGGESFLNLRRLKGLVREAKKQKYIVSVMTSGYWASSRLRTRKVLAGLKEDGLDMIGISLDLFHLKFIDEGNCVNVAEAGAELGLPVAVRVIIKPDDDYGKYVEKLVEHTRAKVHVNFLVCLGRASVLNKNAFKSSSGPPRETCETVTAVEVVPGGNVYACCGPGEYMTNFNPLFLGNAQSENLSDILEKGSQNSFMKVINTRGPNGLLEDLRENDLGDLVKIRGRYTDACQLCLDICNDQNAVDSLKRIYQNQGVIRRQNALQFLKMATELRGSQQLRPQSVG